MEEASDHGCQVDDMGGLMFAKHRLRGSQVSGDRNGLQLLTLGGKTNI